MNILYLIFAWDDIKFKTVLTFQYISFLKSIWDRFQNKMYWNEEYFVYNVIIISTICYNYLSVYIVSSTYRDHFPNLSIVSKVDIISLLIYEIALSVPWRYLRYHLSLGCFLYHLSNVLICTSNNSIVDDIVDRLYRQIF
jgi:hypothetical protein